MNSVLLEYVCVLIVFCKLISANESPCPKHFLFEPDKSEDDKWYGVITFKSPFDTRSVTLELRFDKSVIQLGNWFGSVKANSENTVFKLTSKKSIKANVDQTVEIYVVYDPSYDIPPPQLERILLNGREICPEEQQISNTATIKININYPNCGKKATQIIPLIVRGSDTKTGDWPWHTALYRQQDDTATYICGGTLISDRHILTAAHCTTSGSSTEPVNVKDISVILGKYLLNSSGKQEQKRDITKIIVHEGFNKANYHNDISIIITTKPFEITDYVRPLCLWDGNTDTSRIVNRLGTVVGWGRDEHGNSTSNVLKEVELPVIDRLKCVLANPTVYGAVTNENTLCAGYRNGTSACNGDSGGGLVFVKDGTSGGDAVWQIRGIVSNTIGKSGVCDPTYYAIFTDVAKYLDWIKFSLEE